MSKKKEPEKKKKTLPKTTKSQGPVPPRRSTFTDEIIWKYESQALTGLQKGSTWVPKATNSPIATYTEVHSGTEGTEHSFQNIHTPLFSPLGEENCCNLREGEGDTSGIVE